MKKLLLSLIAVFTLSGGFLRAQDLVGNWQGTLEAEKALRIILAIAKDDKGYSAKMYSIDQGARPISATSVTLAGTSFKYSVELIGGNYQGTLSADGNSIVGTWSQGPKPLPLTLVRATKETAWEIPAPAPPPKLMAADANPSFEVATIKPNKSGAHQMQQLTVNGRNFRTRNSSLGDLITFAYQVQIKQVVGAPEWLETDRYDIEATQDTEGAPNPQQVRTMIQKLLADRFKLKFHHDKRDLSAYILSVGKGGSKLKPTEMAGPLPGIGFRPSAEGVSLGVRNGAIGDFTGFLQTLILDRPVVDQTGLKDRFDFTVKFMPDDSQFSGHPPTLPASTEATNAFPNLFTALQDQLGLKLESAKTPVEVIAIDHVEKPSEN
ncbi:hypothetical protein BH10ACI4_BH10ACI4_36530 [soil metagenome]